MLSFCAEHRERVKRLSFSGIEVYNPSIELRRYHPSQLNRCKLVYMNAKIFSGSLHLAWLCNIKNAN